MIGQSPDDDHIDLKLQTSNSDIIGASATTGD
jgi:hypothetical protein